jgi:glycosyltransferase involved in cell wall biosynthesis
MLVTNDVTRDARVRKEAKSAAEAGFDVVVLGVKTPSSAAEETWEPEPGVSVRIRRVSRPMTGRGNAVSRRLRNFRDLGRTRDELARAAIEERPDLVHANDLDSLPAGIEVKSALGCPVVYDAHELYVEMFYPRSTNVVERAAVGLQRTYLAREEARLITRADAVITVNPFIASELAQRYGIDTPEVVLNAPVEEALHEVEFPDVPRPVFIYQGGLTPGRGLAEMVSAFLASGPGSLVVMGDGPLKDSLAGLAETAVESARVHLVPPVPHADVVSAAARADIGLIPYMPTGLNNLYSSPNKLFDYLHAGLAIIASDLPFLAKTLDETGAGLVVSPGDVSALQEAVNRIGSDEAALSSMKEAARAAAPRYTWERQVPVLLDAYRRVLANRHEPVAGVSSGGSTLVSDTRDDDDSSTGG